MHRYQSTVILAAVLLSACASKVDLGSSSTAPIEQRNVVDSSAATPSTTDNRNVASIQASPPPAVDPLNDPKGVLAQRSVYFDYNSFDVKPEFQSTLEAHAKFLRENTNRRVSLEGHADERGSREYNLALGQKRAEAVRRALTLLGVSDKQLEAVSFGEEKPRGLGHDEASWAENRRADLRYL